ncbi:MAG: GAF domain-containing protein, partial [Chloroflexota bacterium]
GNPEKDIVGFRVDDDKVLKEGQSLRNPYDPATIADGSLIILDTSKIPLRDPSGNIIGVLGIARDVTDRNRQEREIRRRASRMEAITEISSTVAGILEVEELLQRVSELTSDRMDHYHAQVYLLNEEGDTLILRASSHETGRMLVNNGHQIAIDANSMVATAARERDVVLSNNVMSNPNYLPNPLLPRTASELAVPIIYGGELLGVLDIQDEDFDAFGEVEVQVKRTLANQVAVSIQNARQFELTQVRLQEVLATNAIADFVRESTELENMLENVFTVAYNSLDADTAVFSFYDKIHNEWQGFVGMGDGMDSETAKTFIDPGERYPHGLEAINTGEVVAITHVDSYEGFPTDFVENYGMKSVLTVPIIVSGEAIGTLFLNYISDVKFFSEDDLRLARTIGSQVSVGIERQRSEQQVRQQSSLVEASPDLIGFTSPEGEVLYLNSGGMALVGYTREEIIGESLEKFHVPDDVQFLRNAALREAIEKGSWSGRLDMLRKDGSTFPVDQTIFTITDDAGNLLNFATVARDVSAQVAAERQTNTLAEINNALAQAYDEETILQA